MTQTVRFLILLEAIGLAGVPLAARALARLPGAGLGFARILAWLLLAWLVWMLASLGLPNGVPLTLVCAVAVAAGAFALHRRHPRGDQPPDPFRRRLWIWSEVLFVVTFLVAALIGSYSADVWGTEKPLDMMLINANLTSDSIPPHDPWYAGPNLNYYYLGQNMVALLIRLTDVEPTQGYNLALATVFALIVTTAFTLAATIAEAGRRQGLAIRRPLGAGAMCVVLLALMGNLRAGWDALHASPMKSFDWFAPTRFDPNTINEFPFFSWTVGDVHAHVIALPLTLLALAFVVQAALGGPPRLSRLSGWWETLCAALVIGWMYGAHSWSWPVVAGLLILGAGVWMTSPASSGRRKAAAGWVLLVLVLGVVLVLPFIVTFDPNARGFGFTTEAQREPFGTFLRHHGVIEGGLLWLLVAPLVARARGVRHRLRWAIWGLGAVAIVLPLLATANLAGAAVLAALVAATLAAALRRDRTTTERTLWVIAAVGLGCLLAAEVGLVRDEFTGTPYVRLNTVFKMSYQTWILLAVFGAVALAAAREWLPPVPRTAWLVVASVLVGISLSYVVVGTVARKAGFSDGPRLHGREWLARMYPGDVPAIDWLRAHTPSDAVIVEAVGAEYSAEGYARMSTYSGRSTVMGWEFHESEYNHPPETRRADVDALYRATDPALVRTLLDRYDVDYVIVGPLERNTYGDPTALLQEGRKVFDRDGTSVYAY